MLNQQYCSTLLSCGSNIVEPTILFNIVSTILLSCVSNIVEPTIQFNIVSTILLSNDEVTRLFMAVGNRGGGGFVVIEQP